MKNIKLTKWSLTYKNKKIPASVPGDITIDLFNAGLISDPYVAENYKKSEWVGHTDFIYQCDFEVTAAMLKTDCVNVVFKGIDLFADIFINDKKIGKTKNAFLKYSFPIKKYLKAGKNKIEVKMSSTLNAMDKIDTTGYSAIFNLPRIFVRKPQCHFGWDWAPKICAYGLIDDVYLEFKNKYQINDVNVIADDKGNTIFKVELNFDHKDLFGPNYEVLKKGEPAKDDKVVYYISKEPFGNDYEKYEVPMMGKKNYLAIKRKAKLWWPNGYGEQPLYNYIVELSRDGKVVDRKEGRFAYRSVEIKEEPKDNNIIGLDFYINGKKIFLKGSNWIPPECFTGVMKDSKYRQLIELAKDMNANILRVWGGGAYEKDVFFDICDELGILVWQDVTLACADVPEENVEFKENLLEEVEYQVKRLRNHPSLIYWCGGNEKTGSCGNCATHGDFLVNCILYGVIKNLDPTRPYHKQSPYSYTDIGNDTSTGDSHYNCFENAAIEGFENYREHVASRVVPFIGESAAMGPSSVETLKKIFPKEKLWPINDMWADRFMSNPYCALPEDFAKREMKYATKLFGEVNCLEDFVMKAMCAQAEGLRAEAEYSRAHEKTCGAFLNWMFNDIWPSGTWSVLDYYLEPKHAYYQLRKSFAPILVSFYQDNKKMTHLFVNNQTLNTFQTTITYGVKTYDGKVIFKNKAKAAASLNKNFDAILKVNEIPENCYLFAKYLKDGKEETVIYSPNMYRNIKAKNDFTYEVERKSDYHIYLKIHANEFTKSLFIHFKNNFKYLYSDNYLDLEKGQFAIVEIKSNAKINEDQILIDTLK